MAKQTIQTGAVLLLAALACAGCGGEPLLLISLAPVPDAVVALRLNTTVGGLQSSLEVPKDPLRFTLRLPDGVQGPIRLSIAGLERGGCFDYGADREATATGQARIDLDLTLGRMPRRLCPLLVQRSGPGQVRADDSTTIDCGRRCSADVPAGVGLRLTATPDDGAEFVGWSGPCTGTLACDWVPQERGQLKAQFRPTAPVWLVGQGGTIFRWDGRSLQAVPSGTTKDLHGIWGPSATDVWAVGAAGTILHWDGQSWTPRSASAVDLMDVWGSGPADVWAVGRAQEGTILHFDGARWTAVSAGTTAPLAGVWGSGPSDVWAVGEQGTIVHYNGANWFPFGSGTGADLVSIWGAGPRAVWAAGSDRLTSAGSVVRWDGDSWRLVHEQPKEIRALWGSGAGDVLALHAEGIFSRWDGAAWAAFPLAELPPLAGAVGPPSYRALWGRGQGEIWALGDEGSVQYWNGARWSPRPPGEFKGRLHRAWGASLQ